MPKFLDSLEVTHTIRADARQLYATRHLTRPRPELSDDESLAIYCERRASQYAASDSSHRLTLALAYACFANALRRAQLYDVQN